MNRKRRNVIAISATLLSAFAIFCVLPLAVAGGVRGWLWWHARQEGLTISVGSIDSPLLRPVVMHQLHLRSARAGQPAFQVEIDRAQFELDLRAVLTRSAERRLRDLAIENARVTLHRNEVADTANAKSDWRPLRRIFADNFRISHLDVRVENRDTIVDARDISLSASELETGTITIKEVGIASPLIRQRFTDLRGATSWQNQRLTLAAITLRRGVDIDALTVDLSHVALQRIGLEFNADVFGGKVRANVTTETRAGRPAWDVAGTASGISLAQMSETLASPGTASGTLRACKFTFRGDTADLVQSSASVWLELNQLSWRGSTADTIMLGASLYNRRLHLDQLYVKQEENQLTLSADAPLTFRGDDSLKPGVNVDVSANLKDVGALARLFGARPNEYSGELSIEGALAIEGGKRRAALTASGVLELNDARLVGGSRLTAKLACTGTAATIDAAQFTNSEAAVAARGDVDFDDLRDVRARLFPVQPAGDATAVASGACVNGFSFVSGLQDSTPIANVTEIDVRGGLFARDWSVSLIDGSNDAPEQRIARTFQLCPATSSAGEVRLSAAPTSR